MLVDMDVAVSPGEGRVAALVVWLDTKVEVPVGRLVATMAVSVGWFVTAVAVGLELACNGELQDDNMIKIRIMSNIRGKLFFNNFHLNQEDMQLAEGDSLPFFMMILHRPSHIYL